MQGIFPITAFRATSIHGRAAIRLGVGLVLLLTSWWMAWLGPAPFSYHTFFPLWLGYILAADGLTELRAGSSLLSRSPREFALLFALSVPLWWLFELANRHLDNWRYLLPYPYDPWTFMLTASVSFSTVIPAIFVTAELLRTFSPFAAARIAARFDPDRRQLMLISVAGIVMFVLALMVPRYLFPLVWIGFFFALDPVNEALGNPSIVSQLRQGRWDTVMVLFAAGLACGFLWELWNVNSMPKWVYTVPLVGEPRLFEMPVLGYGGYLPFALEVFAAWSLLRGLFPGRDNSWLGFTRSRGESRTRAGAKC